MDIYETLGSEIMVNNMCLLSLYWSGGLGSWTSGKQRIRGRSYKQVGIMFSFSYSTLVFAHSKCIYVVLMYCLLLYNINCKRMFAEEKLINNLSRLVVVVWIFVVLIQQSSYMAS